ncbi:MAG TPA: BMP family protein [Gemmatimonadaceae bacterium]|nr:BMP family protein [Gemmatimonadaceae bacterium]
MRGLPFPTFAFGLLIAGAGACGSESGGGSSGAFRVALLTPGPVTDQSWNAGAYTGLLRIRDSLGAQISHIQTRAPAEFEENFREYGRQGYRLIIGHGFEFQDAAARVAPRFPASTYIVTSSTVAGPNYLGVRFEFEEPAYLAGMIAGVVTKTGVIGAIGGTELPPVRDGFAAYTAGARSVRPDVRVVTSYIGNWDDVSAGKEQALAQISQGVDLIFQNADAAGLGVFQAARETRRALVFGSNADQNAVAPDVIIGSVVIDLPHALLTVARRVREGPLPGEALSLGAETDAVRFAFNPALTDRLPAGLPERVDSAWQRMRRGELTVPRDAVPAEGASPASTR